MNDETILSDEVKIERASAPRYKPSLLTNVGIIGLFLLTFCEIKGCNGKYTTTSGYEFLWMSIQSIQMFNVATLIMTSILAAYGASIVSLMFCFGNRKKMEKRIAICAIVGCCGMSAFIIVCLSLGGIIVCWPPFLVAILHLANSVYYLSKRKPISPVSG